MHIAARHQRGGRAAGRVGHQDLENTR